MNNETKEFRILNEDSLIRKVDNSDKESRKIEGYALVFNRKSGDLGGFTEIIDSQAIDGILENQDVLALLNHDENRGLLARYTKGKGTLNLSIDNRGLKYSFEAPKTSLGDEVLEGVIRGDINASSFGFTVGKHEWRKLEDNTHERKILKFDTIFDVSPAYRPAYQDTDVKIALRSLDSIKSQELKNYYKQWDEKLNKE